MYKVVDKKLACKLTRTFPGTLSGMFCGTFLGAFSVDFSLDMMLYLTFVEFMPFHTTTSGIQAVSSVDVGVGSGTKYCTYKYKLYWQLEP